ncbi:MAG: hypothetical protein ACXVII_36605 [Solirubrobacteraceae bacterium]
MLVLSPASARCRRCLAVGLTVPGYSTLRLDDHRLGGRLAAGHRRDRGDVYYSTLCGISRLGAAALARAALQPPLASDVSFAVNGLGVRVIRFTHPVRQTTR